MPRDLPRTVRPAVGDNLGAQNRRQVGTLFSPSTESVTRWVDDVVQLCQPDYVEWISDSPQTRERLTQRLLDAGTFTQLNSELRPNSYLARSTSDDVARVESRTFICSNTPQEAGDNNNWRDPLEMKAELLQLFEGSMAGRVMYVIPFTMGHEDSPLARYGVEITDSPYVALSMLTMTRVNDTVHARVLAGAPFVPAIHSVGYPLVDSLGEPRKDVPWPSNPTKYISHFPGSREIWSFGSGYGGNALLGKKSFALRIASCIARDEGWLAEHMLLIRAVSPQGKKFHFVAAFPSACGKTNLAMLEPTLPGWTVETIGDDIAWMWVDSEGALRAINPETGFFGVAPGTGPGTNPVAMSTIQRDTIFTNVALTDQGDVWWEGMSRTPPDGLTDWLGQPWDSSAGTPAAHPNSRFTASVGRCPTAAADWEDPAGVIVDGIIFGGRRADTIPVVAQAASWDHGVLMGASIVSERTAAAEGTLGELRPDPFAMAPFLGYAYGEHWAHWLQVGRRLSPDRMPQIFQVNWFRRDASGFLWPGFSENSRVLEWMVRRIESARSPISDDSVALTAAGYVPSADDLDLSGLADTKAVPRALAVSPDEWRLELERQREFIDQHGGTSGPALREVLDLLDERCD